MIKIENKQKCSGCHACASICPKGCIEMKRDSEGFLYPCVDKNACIECGLCEKICPIITPRENSKKPEDIKAYGAFSNTREVRKYSSSGGMFTLIAEQVINKGGIVFGVAFNDDFSVSHQSATSKEELAKFRGSKYVQSTIGNTYKEAKEHLDNGRLVLFTGTPCQIGGLYSYLGKNYDNLITQDIICHGVPSPMVWQRYKVYQENVNKSKIKSASFRNKETGWKCFSMRLDFENNNAYSKSLKEDYFLKLFLLNLCLRPSCYDCAFKTKIRPSDITLADFWGIDNVMSEMNDNKGTSLVFVNSQNGQALFDSIQDNIVYKETDINEAIKYNSSTIRSVTKPKNRDAFMSDIAKNDFEKTAKKYSKTPFIVKLKRKLKSILR